MGSSNFFRICVLSDLSDFETDTSISDDNLSNEERYVIRHTTRQDPQGEENSAAAHLSPKRDSSSSYNTFIIHGVRDENSKKSDHCLSQSTKRSLACDSGNAIANESDVCGNLQSLEVRDIPDEYLNQSFVLKHLAKEAQMPQRNDDKYTDTSNIEICRNLSKSQPDLSRIEEGLRSRIETPPVYKEHQAKDRLRTEQYTFQKKISDRIWNKDMIERLLQENAALKLEVDNCYTRISKSQKLEHDVLKIHAAHEELVTTCERRERLERTARTKLQLECRRLQDANKMYRSHLDGFNRSCRASSSSITSNSIEENALRCAENSAPFEIMRQEITKRDVIISQLIGQNKELIAVKDRQEIELAAQRATLQEQRIHIDFLEATLSNAQVNIVRLEAEKKQNVQTGNMPRNAIHITNEPLTNCNSTLQINCDMNQTKESGMFSAQQNWPHQIPDDISFIKPAPLRCDFDLNEYDMNLRNKVLALKNKYTRHSYGDETENEQPMLDNRSSVLSANSVLRGGATECKGDNGNSHNFYSSRSMDLKSEQTMNDKAVGVLQHPSFKAKSGVQGLKSLHQRTDSLASSPDSAPDCRSILSRETIVDGIRDSMSTNSKKGSSNNSYSESGSSFMDGYDQSQRQKSLDYPREEPQPQSQLLSKRVLCCLPRFLNPVAAAEKEMLTKPLLKNNPNAMFKKLNPIVTNRALGIQVQNNNAAESSSSTTRQFQKKIIPTPQQQPRLLRNESSNSLIGDMASNIQPPSNLPRCTNSRNESRVNNPTLKKTNRQKRVEVFSQVVPQLPPPPPSLQNRRNKQIHSLNMGAPMEQSHIAEDSNSKICRMHSPFPSQSKIPCPTARNVSITECQCNFGNNKDSHLNTMNKTFQMKRSTLSQSFRK